MHDVIIDGAVRPSTDVDPATHTYIGTFRPPSLVLCGSYVLCRCGQVLQTTDQVIAHEGAGHFDLPQYRTVPSVTSTPRGRTP